MYSLQSPPGMLDQGVQKEQNTCYTVGCWIATICVWASIAVSLYFYISEGKVEIFGALGFFYIVYLVLEFCSTTSRYLCNKSTDQGMYEQMGRNFQTPPEIRFHCECYHYETRHHTRTNKDGKTEHYTTTEKIVTYTEVYSLPYYSERDVSGLFYLNCDRAYIEQKAYIKLELQEEINFADAISYYDYERAKAFFWRKNRFRDAQFSFWETRIIPGMKHHNLVKMVAVEPCIVNYFFFFIFTILTIGEIYSILFQRYCVYQKFKVRKLVSTRYDLNLPVYQGFVPQLNLIVNQYSYEPNYYNYVNQSYDLQLPTKEELEQAKQYQDKVPDYQLSSGGGDVQAGVIMDNPGYSSFNANEAPAEFAAVSGDVCLSQDQINKNGGPPSGYDQPGFQFNIAPAGSNPPSSGEMQGYYPPNA